MPVDHAVRRRELVVWMRGAADQHNRATGGPGEPGQTTAEADEEVGMAQPARAFRQRTVAGFVLWLEPHAGRRTIGVLPDLW